MTNVEVLLQAAGCAGLGQSPTLHAPLNARGFWAAEYLARHADEEIYLHSRTATEM